MNDMTLSQWRSNTYCTLAVACHHLLHNPLGVLNYKRMVCKIADSAILLT